MAELDAVVHDLYKEVSEQINCLECANCCTETSPILNQADIDRLAGAVNTTSGTFKKKYLVEDKDGAGHSFSQTPCPFLSGKHCTVYQHRPEDCRSYPHLHKPEFVSRSLQAFSNCWICPIVFNVYESLKSEFHDEFEAHKDVIGDELHY